MEKRFLNRIRGERAYCASASVFLPQIALARWGTIGVLVLSVFIFNFILFSIRVSGQGSYWNFWTARHYGLSFNFSRGARCAHILFILILECSYGKFPFRISQPNIIFADHPRVARRPRLDLRSIEVRQFNDDLRVQAHQHHLPPPFNDMYDRAGRPSGPGSGTCKCTVTAINGNTISADDIDVDSVRHLTIVVPANDPLLTSLKAGDVIFVAGDESSSTIRAYGIQKRPPSDDQRDADDSFALIRTCCEAELASNHDVASCRPHFSVKQSSEYGKARTSLSKLDSIRASSQNSMRLPIRAYRYS